jgi:hypothetical protein
MSAVLRASRTPMPWAERLPSVKRNNEEEKLQATVMQYLALALPPGAVAHHSPGEGLRSKRAQGELKRSGYQKGWPDIEVIYRGRSYFIELKAPGSYPSAAQRTMHQRLEYCGCPVLLCRSGPEVEAGLRGLGLPLRATFT